MVPVGSSVMLELVLAVHSYHVIPYPDYRIYERVISLLCFSRYSSRSTAFLTKCRVRTATTQISPHDCADRSQPSLCTLWESKVRVFRTAKTRTHAQTSHSPRHTLLSTKDCTVPRFNYETDIVHARSSRARFNDQSMPDTFL